MAKKSRKSLEESLNELYADFPTTDANGLVLNHVDPEPVVVAEVHVVPQVQPASLDINRIINLDINRIINQKKLELRAALSLKAQEVEVARGMIADLDAAIADLAEDGLEDKDLFDARAVCVRTVVEWEKSDDFQKWERVKDFKPTKANATNGQKIKTNDEILLDEIIANGLRVKFYGTNLYDVLGTAEPGKLGERGVISLAEHVSRQVNQSLKGVRGGNEKKRIIKDKVADILVDLGVSPKNVNVKYLWGIADGVLDLRRQRYESIDKSTTQKKTEPEINDDDLLAEMEQGGGLNTSDERYS